MIIFSLLLAVFTCSQDVQALDRVSIGLTNQRREFLNSYSSPGIENAREADMVNGVNKVKHARRRPPVSNGGYKVPTSIRLKYRTRKIINPSSLYNRLTQRKRTRLEDALTHYGSNEVLDQPQRSSSEVVQSEIKLSPLYDEDTGISYTREQLDKICEQTRGMSSSFGIRDISNFAKNNCALIRIYYPDISCNQINSLISYCNKNGLLGSSTQ